jgi:hypothetical protein
VVRSKGVKLAKVETYAQHLEKCKGIKHFVQTGDNPVRPELNATW